jgi:hypothetical protein
VRGFLHARVLEGADPDGFTSLPSLASEMTDSGRHSLSPLSCSSGSVLNQHSIRMHGRMFLLMPHHKHMNSAAVT